MAFQFNNQQPPAAQASAPPTPALTPPASGQGIASLPSNFSFNPQQPAPVGAINNGQPLTNAQLGINAGGATDPNIFANSMKQWEAARQAELASMNSGGAAAAPLTGNQLLKQIQSPINPMEAIANRNMPAQASNTGSILDRIYHPATQVNSVAAPAPTPFTIAPVPTDPQQYTQYVQQQQAAFNAAKALRGG